MCLLRDMTQNVRRSINFNNSLQYVWGTFASGVSLAQDVLLGITPKIDHWTTQSSYYQAKHCTIVRDFKITILLMHFLMSRPKKKLCIYFKLTPSTSNIWNRMDFSSWIYRTGSMFAEVHKNQFTVMGDRSIPVPSVTNFLGSGRNHDSI